MHNHPNNLVEMGYIANAFGIQGWVKIKVTTEFSDSLDEYSVIYLKMPNGSVVSKKIETSFVRDDIYHAKFSGINDRDSAFALRGAVVAVDRAEFPNLDDDEYYWVDLLGLTVVNLDNDNLGTVTSLMETGANDVLVVKSDDKQHLIPFVAQYIIEVKQAEKQIIVDWGIDY
jgi:16S rRNA processing protein RimM